MLFGVKPSPSVNVNVEGIPALKSSENICAFHANVAKTKTRILSFFLIFNVIS